MNEIKLGYEDITVVPEVVSTITSRKECNCFDENQMLPIFTAPMDGVIDLESSKRFTANGINVVLPRTIPFDTRVSQLYNNTPNSFVAFSLTEAKELFLKEGWVDDIIHRLRTHIEQQSRKWYVCIDIANGHMQSLIDAIADIKKKYGNKVVVMSGNIANPKTYELYEQAGCDFVRCNIGSGSRCSTASNTSIFYPSFSLIKEIWEEKQRLNGKCKIIADGGIKGYRDIQKALIYADYVMIGSLFNKAINTAGTPYYGKTYSCILGKRITNPFKTFLTYGKPVKPEDYVNVLKLVKKGKLDVIKNFYGMSTKVAQERMTNSKENLKTSEGIVKPQAVEYTLEQWVENEIDYLRSVMSYTNSRTLEEYKNSKWVRNAYRAYND